MISAEILAAAGIAAVVGTLVVWQLAMSIREAFLAPIVVDALGLEADLRRRAERGHEPDWYRYEAEIERSVEPLDESLRSRAATCLTLGVLGTIVSVGAISLLSSGNGGEVGTLLQHLSLALVGNLIGIIVNIFISRVGIPRLESRAAVLSDEVRRTLREAASAAPPRVLDAGAYEALFARALKDSLSALPGAVDRMAQLLRENDESATRRELAVAKLAQQMGASASEVATAASALAPVAEVYARVAATLEQVPVQLGQALREAREGWVEDVREVHAALASETRKYVDEAREQDKLREERHSLSMHGIQSNLDAVRVQLERLPTRFEKGSEEAGKNLAGAFRRTAGEEFDRVKILLQQELQKIAEFHRTEQGRQLAEIRSIQHGWLQQIGGATADVVKLASDGLRESLLRDLQAVSAGLASNAATLGDLGLRLAEAHERVAEAQAASVNGWYQVGRKVEAASANLASVNQDFSAAEAKLREVAESLSHFRDLAAMLPLQLEEGARLSATEHLSRLEPVHLGLMAVTERLADAQRRQAEVAKRLVDALAEEVD